MTTHPSTLALAVRLNGRAADVRPASKTATAARAAEGTNRSVLEAAYDRNAGVLYRLFVLRTGGDRAAADDLMQQLWLAAQKNAGTVPADELDYWFRGVARHLLAGRLRKLSAEQRNLPRANAAVAADLADRLCTTSVPAELLSKREVRDQLLIALTELDTADFDLMLAHYFCGQSHAQIAAQSGISERAVEGRLYRARSALREKLRHLAD